MKPSTESHLLVHPKSQTGEYVRVTPETVGWEHLSFAARTLSQGETWQGNTGQCEYGFVVLGGTCSVESSRGSWPKIGRRPDVFRGMPYALYLPRETDFTVTALAPWDSTSSTPQGTSCAYPTGRGEGVDIACGWCRSEGEHPPRLVTPEQVAVEIRGGGNATRQINSLFPPGFDCHRLVAVEVYTPAGSSSSYPPHKHDVHRVDAAGKLLEADLEETYFYKFDRPEGYAIQRVYTSDWRLNEVMVARNNDVVLVPEGYHPVAAAHGYPTYYLNFLAGSAQSLANVDDPEHAWIKESWTTLDPRVPLVTIDMEKAADGKKG